MKVLCDDNGFITSFAIIGDLVDSINVLEPEDISHFIEHFSAYKVNGDCVVFDDEQNEILQHNIVIEEYRVRREKECFPVVNRGQLWYDTITDEQKFELNTWYHNWLDVTETEIIPEKPIWLK